MKILPRKHRETSRDWFGKKVCLYLSHCIKNSSLLLICQIFQGISNHITCVQRYQEKDGELYIVTESYACFLSDLSQQSAETTCGILFSVLKDYKKKNPHIKANYF